MRDTSYQPGQIEDGESITFTKNDDLLMIPNLCANKLFDDGRGDSPRLRLDLLPAAPVNSDVRNNISSTLIMAVTITDIVTIMGIVFSMIGGIFMLVLNMITNDNKSRAELIFILKEKKLLKTYHSMLDNLLKGVMRLYSQSKSYKALNTSLIIAYIYSFLLFIFSYSFSSGSGEISGVSIFPSNSEYKWLYFPLSLLFLQLSYILIKYIEKINQKIPYILAIASSLVSLITEDKAILNLVLRYGKLKEILFNFFDTELKIKNEFKKNMDAPYYFSSLFYYHFTCGIINTIICYYFLSHKWMWLIVALTFGLSGGITAIIITVSSIISFIFSPIENNILLASIVILTYILISISLGGYKIIFGILMGIMLGVLVDFALNTENPMAVVDIILSSGTILGGAALISFLIIKSGISIIAFFISISVSAILLMAGEPALSVIFLSFYFVIPFINAVLDWISWMLSRYFIISARNSNSTMKILSDIAIDFSFGIVFMLTLCLAFPAGAEIINYLYISDIKVFLDWEYYAVAAKNDPWGEGLMVTLMIISTLVPTFIHILVGIVSILITGFGGYELATYLENTTGNIRPILGALWLVGYWIIAFIFILITISVSIELFNHPISSYLYDFTSMFFTLP